MQPKRTSTMIKRRDFIGGTFAASSGLILSESHPGYSQQSTPIAFSILVRRIPSPVGRGAQWLCRLRYSNWHWSRMCAVVY
jgi:hypothetical protein